MGQVSGSAGKPRFAQRWLRVLVGDDAAKRAFFVCVLALFGSWLLLALFVFTGWDRTVFWYENISNRMCGLHTRPPLPVWILPLPPLLWLAAAAATLRLWHPFLKRRRLAVCGVLAAATAIIAAAWRILPGAILLIYPLLILPLAAYPRQWKLVLLRGAAWGFALFIAWRGIRPLLAIACGPFDCTPFDRAGNETWWSVLAVLSVPACLLGVWLTAVIVARATGRAWRSLFGRGAVTVLALFAAVYLCSLGLAFAEQARTKRRIAALERFHGAPATGQTFRDRYYAGRSADGQFWKNAVALYGLESEDEELVEDLKAPPAPALLDKWRDRLAKSRKYQETPRLLAVPPPPNVRDYDGDLLDIPMPEWQVLLRACRYEAWRIRFAVADGDAKAALAALRRMDNALEYLDRDDFLVAGVARHRLSRWRLDMLESMLDARLLTPGELRRQRDLLAREIGSAPARRRRIALAEAATWLRICDKFAHGGIETDLRCNKMAPGKALYPFRWLLPLLWYNSTRTRGEIARLYRIDDLERFPAFPPKSFLMRWALPSITSLKGKFNTAREKRLLERLDAALRQTVPSAARGD